MLDDIGFAWDAQDTEWKENFAQLVTYKAERGTFSIPSALTGTTKAADVGVYSEKAIMRGTCGHISLSPVRRSKLK